MTKFDDFINNELIPHSEFWNEFEESTPEVFAWTMETIYKWAALYDAQRQFFPEQFDEIREHIVAYISKQSIPEKDKLRRCVYLAWIIQEQFYDGMEPGESTF
jgi:hypothetical protein